MASKKRNALAELAEQVKRERNALAFYDVRSYEVAEALRQSADAMEREENKKKNFEYGLRDVEGFVSRYHSSTLCCAQSLKTKYETVVRREVGEWEEVKDGE